MDEPTTTPATPAAPIGQVIGRIDAMLAELAIRGEVLRLVRDMLSRALGEQTGGSRPGDRA